jgi:hypothetical protein
MAGGQALHWAEGQDGGGTIPAVGRHRLSGSDAAGVWSRAALAPTWTLRDARTTELARHTGQIRDAGSGSQAR